MYASWMDSASADALAAQMGIYGYGYEPQTSAEGLDTVTNDGSSFHFAGVDTGPSPPMPNVWVVPSVAQGVAIVFNVPIDGVKLEELNITREELADVFLGTIQLWSELAPRNPSLASVHEKIALVVQKDPGMVSYILTNALSRFSPEWNAKVGSSSNPRWPWPALMAAGDAGVAIQVMRTPYSLGYTSLSAIASTGARKARVSNKAGSFVLPANSTVVAAMDAFEGELNEMGMSENRTDFSLRIVDPAQHAPDAYPIAGFTYFAFDMARLNVNSLRAIIFLIHWSWTNVQAAKAASRFGFIPISPRVSKSILSALNRIRFSAGSDSCPDQPSEQATFSELQTVMFMISGQIHGAGPSNP